MRNRKIENVLAGTEVEGPDVVGFVGPTEGRLQSAPYSQSVGLLIGVTSPGGAACSSTQPLGSSSPATMWPESMLLRIAERPKDKDDPSYLLYLSRAGS